MGVNFSPFEIGRRALHASQYGINITGQNIANVNTPGYSRQSVVLSASPSDGPISRGVTIDGVRSYRDKFVDARLQTETAISGRLTAKRDALSPVEVAFNESNSSGIGSAISGFFSAFGDLESHPTSLPVRGTVVAKGQALASALHTTRQRLVDSRTDADRTILDTANTVNTLTKKVADLNAQISIAENTGGNSSALQDQRGEAVRQLSELAGTRSVENQDGSVTLSLADGRSLVVGNNSYSLQAVPTPPNGLTSLLLEGQPATITDGKLRGLLDAVGEIGGQITALDELAASIAARVNTLHTSGSDLNGNNGAVFFTVPANGDPITAANISVSAPLTNDPRLLVAAANGAGTGDGTVARSITNLLTDTSSQAGTRVGSFSSIYASIVADAGASVKSADDQLITQQAILAQTTAQREAVSGVSLDEEAINLLQYQKAYEAAARFLRIADEMTQTIFAIGS